MEYLAMFSCMLLGALAGMAELFPRYRDDPFKAAFSGWGFSYLVLNAIISLLAFLLMYYTFPVAAADLLGIGGQNKEATESLAKEGKLFASASSLVILTLAAGLGAMVLLRTKIFTIRLRGGEEFAVGPEYIITTFLTTIDNYIDKKRAQERTNLVYSKFGEIPFSLLKHHAAVLLEGPRQNIPKEEAQALGETVANLSSNNGMPDEERALSLGFTLVDILGEDYFRNVDIKSHLNNRGNGPDDNADNNPAREDVPIE